MSLKDANHSKNNTFEFQKLTSEKWKHLFYKINKSISGITCVSLYMSGAGEGLRNRSMYM